MNRAIAHHHLHPVIGQHLPAGAGRAGADAHEQRGQHFGKIVITF
jgi:NADPH:quinone reductase-like Zn-dependent oxidoreductase